MLYINAVVAARFNPVIRAFYHRLCRAGKAKKVALTACIRKLLVILNAMLKQPHKTGSEVSDRRQITLQKAFPVAQGGPMPLVEGST